MTIKSSPIQLVELPRWLKIQIPQSWRCRLEHWKCPDVTLKLWMHIAKSHHKCRIISTQNKNMSLKTCTPIYTYLYIYISTYIYIYVILYVYTYMHMFNKSKPKIIIYKSSLNGTLPGLHRRCQGWRMGSAARDLGTPSRLRRGATVSKVSAVSKWLRKKKTHRLD